MTRRVPWVLCVLMLLPVWLAGCGVNFPPKQQDEPCTRTSQCEEGLECSAGVCQPSADAGVDAGS
ncbi:MAG: hypothetical protein WBN70_07465 [Polyangiales bacterium]